MRKSRIAPWAASLLLAAACTLAGPAATAAAPGIAAAGYVALGDSYSAGVGAGSYLTATPRCLRSSLSFPALWAAAHSVSSFSFAACDGAKTGDVLKNQLGPLGPRTGLVTITAGGRDAGFTKVMAACVLGGSGTCLSAVAKARSATDGTLPGDLDRLYSAIRGKAPAARVVVLGYPRLYQLHGGCSGGLRDIERSALNDASDHLDEVLAARAAAHGFTFVDVRSAFGGHEICSPEPWLHSADWLDLGESYHPTATGHSLGYLPLLTDAL
ncbi:SGNH/GDSL hydrolase family protein [Streptomyces dangxiongensis]|uniref:SGNH/GDSL hydrolase family protein n=1 Tax=Streptomyces dangxiongensis TaxID=1442032 RepID=A0A3G2JP09_9ACTN|nr:SGNH/GDSL hydrolase family protein [Streptomyces dangxiongensis]AYN43175.1 SGNH/GDSL hydrolase family protein [Streptomyces dangxiongensis]